MAKITWDRFQWRAGEDVYAFETENGGLYGTLKHVGGRSVTLPMVAWEGMVDCLQLERKSRTQRVSDLPQRSGARWSDAETERLTDGFRRGMTIPQLSSHHARTEAAIEAQLERLGLWNRLEHRPLQSGQSQGTPTGKDAFDDERGHPFDTHDGPGGA